MISALKHRDYAVFAATNFLANVGIWVQRIAAQWLAWELTGSFAWLGGLAMAEAIAILLITPLGGAMTDRIDRLKLARSAQFVTMLISALLAVLTMLDMITPALLAVIVFSVGVAEGFWAPARLAIVPNLAPKESIASALSISALLFNVSWVLGPAVGGFLIATVGIGGAFVFSALSVLSLLVALSVIRLVRSFTPGASAGILRDVASACVYVARSKLLAPIIIISAASSMLLRPYRDLLAGLSDAVFQRGEHGLAAFATASGVGAIVAAGLLAMRRRADGAPLNIAISLVLGAIGLGAIGLTANFSIALAAAALLGFAITIGAISGQIMVQQVVPDAMRGRVLALWGLQVRAAPPIVAWIAGLIANQTGVQLVFVVLAGCALVLALATLPALKSLSAGEQAALKESSEEA